MARIYRTSGVILSYRELSETDRLYIVFTKQFGKKTLLTKGIKKQGAKLRYRLSLYAFVYLECVQGRSFDRVIAVTDNTTISDLLGRWAYTLQPYGVALLMFDIIEQVCQDSNPEPEMFAEIGRFFTTLQQTSPKEWDVFVVFIVFRLMFLMGLGVDLTRCVRSGRVRSAQFILHVREGGLVSDTRADATEGDLSLSEFDVYMLRAFQAGYFMDITQQKRPAEDTVHHLLTVSFQYLHYHGISLKSLSFWRHVRYDEM